MGRRNESPEKKRRRELIRELLKDSPLKDGEDVNALMREMMTEVLEGSLDGELEEELGYTRYDYRNKDTDNSRNGFSQKSVRTSYGDMEINVTRDRNGEFEPKIIASIRTLSVRT